MTDIAVTEEDITQLVPLFYQRVRGDAVLGPIFDDAIDDWPITSKSSRRSGRRSC